MYEVKGIRKLIAEKIYQMFPGYRNTSENILNPREYLMKMRSAMVCLPFSAAEFKAALPALKRIFEKFPQSDISVVAPWNFREELKSLPLKTIISLRDYSANCFKLPKKELRDFIKTKRFDVAIDLNPGDTLFSSILCAVCGAKIRVGFAGSKSDDFFNFQVIPNKNRGATEKYLKMIDYLQL